MAATVAVSPLLAGSVHRPAMMVVLVGALLILISALVGERLRNSVVRGPQFSLPLLLLVLIPILQVVPWPTAWRALVDPAGLALLENGPHGAPRLWPLSLDRVATRDEIGIAAAALVVFLVALHSAAGRRRPTLVLTGIALGGIVAVVSGIAHRVFGIDHLYGLFKVSGSVLPGPFINGNHSAEFFELAAFAALALAQENDSEIRIGWYVAAGVNAAAALTTLSRGSLLPLFAGGATFVALRLRGDEDLRSSINPPMAARGRTRKIVVLTLFALGCLAAVAFALGAAPVLDEIAHTNLINGTEKVIVWRDSLPIALRHPLGIGRHAFDRVFPAYKTLSLDSRFQFVENAPLQLLIDVGWLAFGVLLIVVLHLVRRFPRRRDAVSAALLAGLVTVLAHNLVDFGLETAGMRLPFAAVAGVFVGRAYGRSAREQRGSRLNAWIGVAAGSTAALGLLFGFAAQVQTTADDIESRWKVASGSEERRRLAIEGGERFPTDFFFPLLQSYDEATRSAVSGQPSPKLAALNRAMRLCPTCSFVHEQAAHALRTLGLRSQALSSFRDVVRLAPSRLMPILIEADRQGYTPADLATLAVGGGPQATTVARFLVPKKAAAKAQVEDLIAAAGRDGEPMVDLLLLRAELALALGHSNDARAVLAEMRRLFPRDGRSYATLAALEEGEGHLEMALDQARLATTMSPFIVDFARKRLGLVIRLQRWSELDESLERLKIALRQTGQNITEVHLAAGQTHQSRGNLGRAFSEFRTAATLDANNAATWAALGRVSEERGDLSGAADAYHRGATINPDDRQFSEAIARIEKERAAARLRQLLP